MRKIYNKLGMVVTSLLLITGCSKNYLETSPTESYDEGFIFTTTENGLAAVNGIHKAMVAQYEVRMNLGGYPSMMTYMDMLGEDLVLPSQGNGWWVDEYRWQVHRDANEKTTYFTYRFFYMLISNANMILEQIDGATGTEGEKKMIKGQALAYRGLSHFWLVQFFAERYDKTKANDGLGVPLMISTQNKILPRETIANVYKKICEDLEESVRLLKDPENTFKPTSKSHFTPATVEGIRARVALTMQDWENARDYAKLAMDDFGGKLMDREQYNEGFNDATNPEWMWAFHQIPDQTLYFYGFMAFMSYNFNSTNVRSCPKCINSLLYNEIKDTDVRKGLWDPTGKAYTLPTASFTKYKYMNRKFKVADYTSSVADACYMRLGEMYLVLAEAKARLNEADAADVLYTLAKSRDPQYTKSTNTGTDLVNEILLQRRIELWGEGFRFSDLKRLNAPMDRKNSNHDVALAITMTVPVGDLKWQFLIPQKEIDATEGMVIQNPM